MRLLPPIALALVLAGACSSPCHCPAGVALLTLPADLPAPVAEVAADSCSLVSKLDGPALRFVAERATTCHIILLLADGSEATATLTFASAGGCCEGTFALVDSSSLEYADAGPDR